MFSLGGWCRQIQTGFLRSRPTQDTAAVPILACTGLSPPPACLPRQFHFGCSPAVAVLQPRPRLDGAGLGSFPFARRYLGNHSYFLFLRVLRCFSSPGLPPLCGWRISQCAGLPHSDIRGSTVICTSPRLFAACHVLLRLQEPRHPLYALCNLLACFTRFSSSIMQDLYPAWSRFS